jgi:hypothetical protein
LPSLALHDAALPSPACKRRQLNSALLALGVSGPACEQFCAQKRCSCSCIAFGGSEQAARQQASAYPGSLTGVVFFPA